MGRVVIAVVEAGVRVAEAAVVDVVVADRAVVADMVVVTEAMAAVVTKLVPERAKAAIPRGL